MRNRSAEHEAIAWLKQRLEDLDRLIASGEEAAAQVEGNLKDRADRAIVRLKSSREKLEKFHEELLGDAAGIKKQGEDVLGRFEAYWLEVEMAFQELVAGIQDHADATRALLAARAQAQRNAWATSLEDTRGRTMDALDAARGEFDTAMAQMEGQLTSLRSRALQAGDAAWDSLSATVANARAAQERALKAIKAALPKTL